MDNKGDFAGYLDDVAGGEPEKIDHDFVGGGEPHRENGDHNFVPTVTGSREFQVIARLIQADDLTGNDPNAAATTPLTSSPGVGMDPSMGPAAAGTASPAPAAMPAPMAPTITAAVLRYANWCLATRMRPHSMDALDRYAAKRSDREYFILADAIQKSATGTPGAAPAPTGEDGLSGMDEFNLNEIGSLGTPGGPSPSTAQQWINQGVTHPLGPHTGSRRTAAPDYLQKADEALTNLLNQKAEEFQQSVQALQQALVTVQQAEALNQAQNPLGVQPPAGTVNVMPGGDQGGDPSQAMALAGGGPSGGMGGPPQGDPGQQMMAARHRQATDDDNYSSWLSGWADHESDVREREREEAEKKDGKKEAARRRFARLHQAKDCKCWKGYKRVPGTKPCAEGSCEKCDTHKESRRRRQAIQTHPSEEAYRRSIEDSQHAERARNAPPQPPVKFSDEDVEYLKGLGQTPDQAGGGFPDWESYHKHHGARRRQAVCGGGHNPPHDCENPEQHEHREWMDTYGLNHDEALDMMRDQAEQSGSDWDDSYVLPRGKKASRSRRPLAASQRRAGDFDEFGDELGAALSPKKKPAKKPGEPGYRNPHAPGYDPNYYDGWVDGKGKSASNPRDRAGDAWRDGRDRGVAEHGRQDAEDDWDPEEFREQVRNTGWAGPLDGRRASRGRRPLV